MNIYIDFETRSDIPISMGIPKYLNHKSADIICMAYKIEGTKTKLWVPGQTIAFNLVSGDSIYAHNALFDYRVWHILGKKYGLPKWPISRYNWIDSMALCARYTLPLGLENAGKVLNLKIQKQTQGKMLIKKICSPPYNYNANDLYEFYNYCKDDVNTMYELIKTLPAAYLSEEEQEIWNMTQIINLTGIPIDVKTTKLILGITDAYKIEQIQRLPELTDYTINTIGQIKKIVEWVNEKGVPIKNLQAETVEKTLKKDIPSKVKEVLEMRKDLGSSSIKKYKKLLEQEYNGTIFDNLIYYGAGKTGRWAGRGFQLHNLPRAKVKDPEAEIRKFRNLSILEEDPIKSAKALIRPMIKAPKGFNIVAIDFSAIEYILLSWVTRDDYAVKMYASGKDQYKDMASFLCKKAFDDITSDERFQGKVIILGCGYGLGAVGFQGVADSFGLKLTNRECEVAVKAYRSKYFRVKNFWYAAKDCAILAIKNPGIKYTIFNCTFKRVTDHSGTDWLQLTLPSGRALYYMSPSIVAGTYGPEVSQMGTNPYTKKWERLRIIPGRFVENIIQALARDILAYSKLKLIQDGYRVIGSVHDEILCIVPDDDVDYLDMIIDLACETPKWCEDMPLKATGYMAKRYKKD